MAFLDIFKKKKQRYAETEKIKYQERAKDKARKAAVAVSREKEQEQEPKKEDVAGQTHESERASRMLIHPLITEKSARMSEGGSYAFRVHDHARKPEIKKAVEELYGVRVEKVRLLYAPPKRRTHRGKEGIKPGYKKAMVMLRKGGKIEFI